MKPESVFVMTISTPAAAALMRLLSAALGNEEHDLHLIPFSEREALWDITDRLAAHVERTVAAYE